MTMDMAETARLGTAAPHCASASRLLTQSVQTGLAGRAELEMKRAGSLLTASARLQGTM